MRKLKFKTWDMQKRRFVGSFNLYEISSFTAYELNNIYLKAKEVVFLQYIGLEDKKGREIYEGDIIDAGHTKNYQVKQNKKTACFKLFFKNDFPVCCFDDVHEIKVIGNIYENPELLEDNKK